MHKTGGRKTQNGGLTKFVDSCIIKLVLDMQRLNIYRMENVILKKTLMLLLAGVLLLTSTAVNTSAASFADTKDLPCETAVEVLHALKIVEGKEEGAYAPEDALTRAEMATIVLRLMNMKDTGTGMDIFTDVPSSHWAYANVAAAYQLGIINGTSATTFSPDTAVTYEQAVKMVVAALGYTVQAEALGGYPAGYLSKASQLDLLAGVQTGGEMSRGNMAVLVYNALEVELFQKTVYGDNAYEYATDETKTLLSYYLKIDHTVETVEATYTASSLAQAPRLLSDEVRVGGVTMKVGETDAQNMLGMRADVYTRKDEITEKPIILAIVPRQSVKTVELAAKDVEGFDGAILSYTDAEGTMREADLTNATVIFNGRPAEKNIAHLKPALGTVRLISEYNEVKYAIVESYVNYVVDAANPEEHTVYFKNGVEPMVLDPTDNSIVLSFTDAAGMPLTVADVYGWDILSVAKSEDGSVINVYRSYEVVQGKITEKSADEVVIGETAYAFDPAIGASLTVGMNAGYYLDFTGAVAAINEAYQVGGSYGWMVSAANTKGLDGKPQLKIFTQDAEMKVFDTAATVQLNGTATKSEKLLVRGEYSGEALWTDGKEGTLVDADGNAVPQLIKYEVNEEGLLTSIDTAKNQSDPTLDYGEKYDNNFSMDWYWQTPAKTDGAVEFNGTMAGNTAKKITSKIENISGVVFGHVVADANTKFFSVPADVTREQDYQILALKDYGLEETRLTKYVSFYDVNEDYHCGAMVMHQYLEAGAVTPDTYPSKDVTVAMITGSSITLSEDGEAKNTLKLYASDGKEISVAMEKDMEAFYAAAASDITKDPFWYTKVDGEKKTLTQEERAGFTARYDSRNKKIMPMYISVSDLVPGDVIQYEANAMGELKKASVLLRKDYAAHLEVFQSDSTQKITETTRIANYMSGGQVKINGLVKKITDAGIIIEVHPVDVNGVMKTNVTYDRMLKSAGKFVLWDNAKEEWRSISIADVRQGDSVFAYWNNTSQRFVAVYRGEAR